MVSERGMLRALTFCIAGSVSAAAVVRRSEPQAPSVQPSSANCTWVRVRQPLSHFAPGSTSDASFEQRLCIYDGFWRGGDAPIFLYVGNESPVEEYVNATGLMWETGPDFGALLVFAEHRYFGDSMPELKGTPNCLAYLSSEEALADYASLVSKFRQDESWRWHAPQAPVIAFGGSYGGMLAAWFRMRYPSHVDGAIAASAPIWGLPLTGPEIDGAAAALTNAYTEVGGSSALCASNLKAAWVLLHDVSKTADGRDRVSHRLGLCTPLRSSADASVLLSYLQGAIFNLAEGSYPFATDYIDFATFNGTTAKLPPWPAQKLCEPLAHDFGVAMTGDTRNVHFAVHAGRVEVEVEWNETLGNGYSIADLEAGGALDLLEATARGLNVWFNVTGAQQCLDWVAGMPAAEPAEATETGADTENRCSNTTLDAGLAYQAICCNEGITMANTLAQGIGRDLFWPPNTVHGATLEDVVRGSLSNCADFDKMGLYGTPAQPDEFGVWVDTLYGGKDIQMYTNIFFSNGGLDPWSSGGVLPPAISPSLPTGFMPMAGHHLDLFFASEGDTEPVRSVRAQERESMVSWISESRNSRQYSTIDTPVVLAAVHVKSFVSIGGAAVAALAAVATAAVAFRIRRSSHSTFATPLIS